MSVVSTSILNDTHRPLAVIAGADPRSPMLLGFTPIVASRHREARSDPFMIDLRKIYFQKNFNIDPIDFILMIMNFGKLNTEGKKNRIYLEGKEFRLIVTTEWYGKSKQLLLTAFDLRPISRKNPKRAKEMKKAPKR